MKNQLGNEENVGMALLAIQGINIKSTCPIGEPQGPSLHHFRSHLKSR
jgi:hypothetical protein